MKTIALLASAAALTACGSQPSSAPSSTPTAAPASTQPARLVATRSYRCPDGTPLSIGWMSDRSSATLTVRDRPVVALSSALPGAPLIGSNFIVRGGSGDETVSVTTPNASASELCKVEEPGGKTPAGERPPSGRRR